MDNRKELSVNTILQLGGISYHIDSVIGKGSCAIMYKAWYSDDTIKDAKHHILIKELFPYDIKGGIYRLNDNKIEISEKSRSHYDLYKKSFERGNLVHLKILEKFPEKNGVNINTFAQNNTLYTLLGFGGGRDLETELLVNGNQSLLKTVYRIIGVLSALDEFHKMGYYHLDISPDNVLLTSRDEDERVTLIDYNSVLSEDELSGEGEIFYSLKSGYTAPELRIGLRRKISPATDLYSVVAVFFRTVCGRALTEFESVRRMPPDVSKCGCILNEPETVKSLVKKIVIKGLAQLPEKRYQNVSELKTDFEELKDRILGVGITHWSLWESSRRSVRDIVRNNPSFGFLKEQKNLYNLNVSIDNEIKNTEEFLNDIIKGGQSAVMIGDGGMGKTTSLLNIAYNAGSRYTSSSPAISYISLYGASPADDNYIKDKLLESLRFKSDTKTFEMARHKLKQLLKEAADSNDSPAVVVLIDGFNEISANSQLITDEIKALSINGGIRFVITTRQYNDEFDFVRAYAVPLRDSEVHDALLREGLLLPQNGEMLVLLKNPLMLSIYIEALKSGNRQLRFNDKDELVKEYFTVIARKGTETMTEAEGMLWLNDVSVNYVLPAIAVEGRKKKRALSDEEILRVVKKCYNVLTSKIVSGAFPQWIGHLNDILCGCNGAESWYGIVVRDILWRKTGLLTKNEKGQYRIFHQTIEDYLIESNQSIAQKIRKRVFIRNTAFVSCVLVAFGSVCLALTAAFPELAEKSVFVRMRAVSADKADALLSDMCVSYINCGLSYGIAEGLMANSGNTEEILREYLCYEKSVKSEARKKTVELSQKRFDSINSDGGIMPYSYEKLSGYEEKIMLGKDISDADIYGRYIRILTTAQENGNEEYINTFKEFIKADAEYTAVLFHYSAWRHIVQMDENSALRKTLSDSVSIIPEMESIRREIESAESDIDMDTVIRYEENRRGLFEKMEQLYGKYEILYDIG